MTKASQNARNTSSDGAHTLLLLGVLLTVAAFPARSAAFPGVQTDVPVASLAGWSLCHSDSYGNFSTELSTILTNCNKAHLLLGCRPTGSSNLSVAAHAPRADVTFDTGSDNTPHNANGVGWYFNNDWSWGFAAEGDPIDRFSCDVQAGPNPDKRLCWHTASGFLTDGWRCGAATNLFNNSYERLVFQADALPCGNGVLDVGEPCDDGNLTSGDGCDGICRIENCFACSGQPSMCSPAPNGGTCDDGLFCNGTDTCSAGLCTVHAGNPCSGGTECNNVCDESINTCFAASGTPCTDDGDVCTEDACDGLGACTHPPNFFEPCDDGIFCNGPDFCISGGCFFHDGDPCQFDECRDTCDELAQECDPAAAGTPCFDDFNVCTSDACDGEGVCAHPPGPSGVSCPSDGIVCTADQCDGGGNCAHPPLPNGTSCPDDGNVCTEDECNGSGSCAHPSLPDGSACSDANACTQTDSCASGECVGSDPVVCMAPLCRSAGTCDPTTGTCSSCPAGYTVGAGGCQKRYPIAAGMLTGMPNSCDFSGVDRYSACDSNPFGFQWTDTGDAGVGAPTQVDVQFDSGVDCTFGTAHVVRLNGTQLGVYASTAAGACSCPPVRVPRLLTGAAPPSYAKGGPNAISITTNDCSGFSRDPSGSYATVTVTYEALEPPFVLRDGCREDGRSKLKYRNSINDAQDRLRWLWGHGEATTTAEFADPTASADYQLCIFAETDGAPALILAADVPASSSRWSPVGDTGYKYLDGSAEHDGIRQILLKRGLPTKSKIVLKGKGASLGDPSLPLVGINGIRVQLTNASNGKCWESQFPASQIGGGINAKAR